MTALMVETLTGEQAIELLRSVVADAGPDFVYATPPGDVCVYSYDGVPSCLVGRALAAAGAGVGDLASLCDCSIEGVAQVGHLVLTWDAVRVFAVAQLLQDEGATWGTALQAANTVFDRLDFTSEGAAA